ncbi:MAG: ROK family protein [Fusobacterium sp.]|nr:ROK family protein [Fusobacterium sp.]
MYQKDVKENNINKIFRHIFDMENSVSISDIAKSTNMSFPTVKRVVDEFLEKNIIYEWTLSSRGVGRRAVEYKYNEEFTYLIGCGIDGENLKIILTDAKGNQKISETYKCGDKNIFKTFKEFLKEFIFKLEDEYKDKIMGIGLSIPGIYSQENGFFEIHTLEKEKISALRNLEKEIGYSIWVENEANMSVLTEAILGNHKKLKDFTVVVINDEVTCSTFNKIKSDNSEYFFKASRLSRIIIDCHSQKTVGDYISCKALENKIKEKLNIDSIELFFEEKKYCESDLGKEILEEYVFYLSTILKNLLFTHNPEKLIISGKISKYEEYLLPDILDLVYAKNHLFYRGKDTITFSKYRENANVIGASIFPLVDKMM